MSITATPSNERRSILPAALVAGSVGLLAVGVGSGVSMRGPVILVMLVTLATVALSIGFVAWPQLIGSLILLILFVPIRRYFLPVSLPFQLEPYRIVVALLVLGWCASLLVDSRTRLRRTGFEGPIVLIVASSVASIVANPGRVAGVSSFVDKKLMFFLSFVLVLYVISSVIRRLDEVDFLAKTLVGGGAVVAAFAIVEARTGFNIFNHLSRLVRSCISMRFWGRASRGSARPSCASWIRRSTRLLSAPPSSCSPRSRSTLRDGTGSAVGCCAPSPWLPHVLRQCRGRGS